MDTSTPPLSIDDLYVEIETSDGNLAALNGVNLKVFKNEIVGLIGETGAGKSLTAWSVLGLLPNECHVTSGTVNFDGVNLLTVPEKQRRRIRGKDLAVIVQNPRGALDPLRTVGKQIRNVNRTHRKIDRTTARVQATEALREVGIQNPKLRERSYPHQLSGGMAQRILIAMAMINAPKLILADEPTTGLDLVVQAEILDLLRERVKQQHSSVLLITHDLGVVANYCDRVAVMFAGRIVEEAPVDELFANPRHPYTRALVSASGEKRPETAGRQEPEITLPSLSSAANSSPPDLSNLPPGCHYAYRCPFVEEICRTPVPWIQKGPAHHALCHFPHERGTDT